MNASSRWGTSFQRVVSRTLVRICVASNLHSAHAGQDPEYLLKCSITSRGAGDPIIGHILQYPSYCEQWGSKPGIPPEQRVQDAGMQSHWSDSITPCIWAARRRKQRQHPNHHCILPPAGVALDVLTVSTLSSKQMSYCDLQLLALPGSPDDLHPGRTTYLVTGPDIWLSHWYTIGSEELPANLLSSFSRAALNCWYLHRSCRGPVSALTGCYDCCSMVPPSVL